MFALMYPMRKEKPYIHRQMTIAIIDTFVVISYVWRDIRIISLFLLGILRNLLLLNLNDNDSQILLDIWPDNLLIVIMPVNQVRRQGNPK